MRYQEFKYIRTLVPGEPEELYHLGDDPEELRNLAGEPRYASQLARMRELLVAELERTGAPFARRLPPVASPR